MATKKEGSTAAARPASTASVKMFEGLASNFIKFYGEIGKVEEKRGIKSTVVVAGITLLSFVVCKRIIWPDLKSDSLDICMIFSAVLIIMAVLVINNLEFNETLRSNLREKEVASYYLYKMELEAKLKQTDIQTPDQQIHGENNLVN